MVQAVENLTCIVGEVLGRRPHPTLSGYELVTVRVQEAHPVEGKADLLSRHVNDEIDVAIASELICDASPGAELRFRAKRTPKGAMGEPHPPPGEFSIRPSGTPH